MAAKDDIGIFTVGTLGVLFLIFITAKGELGDYIKLFLYTPPQASSGAGGAGGAAGAGGQQGAATPGGPLGALITGLPKNIGPEGFTAPFAGLVQAFPSLGGIFGK
jgi:hypothetical protein